MNTLKAFEMGLANRNKPRRVFDWAKAARIIRDREAAGEKVHASAGLAGDWEYTGGDIYREGSLVPNDDTYTYLMSTWAVPLLSINGEVSECYIMEDERPEWNASTYWPQEALEILNQL